jgi:hypothetical protein
MSAEDREFLVGVAETLEADAARDTDTVDTAPVRLDSPCFV